MNRILQIPLLALIPWNFLTAFSSPAQIFSQNIVGYYNLFLHPGDNFIANQLSNSNNTLNVLFSSGTPDGTTFTKWDSSTLQYLPVSTYHSATGWSINYSLTYGEGGKLTTSQNFVNTFFGSVDMTYLTLDPAFSFTPPAINSDGLFLLSCDIPIGAGFHDVIGRDPLPNEYVILFNALTQTATTTTFNGSAWDNGTPLLQIGQPAFFGLQANQLGQNAPEPAGFMLTMMGLATLAFTKKTPSKSR